MRGNYALCSCRGRQQTTSKHETTSMTRLVDAVVDVLNLLQQSSASQQTFSINFKFLANSLDTLFMNKKIGLYREHLTFRVFLTKIMFCKDLSTQSSNI